MLGVREVVRKSTDQFDLYVDFTSTDQLDP